MAVEVARLAPENFDKWESFRNILLVRTVSLIQTLSKSERCSCSTISLLYTILSFYVIRLKILQQIEVKEFKDDEYIVRQGEIGNRICTCLLYVHLNCFHIRLIVNG